MKLPRVGLLLLLAWTVGACQPAGSQTEVRTGAEILRSSEFDPIASRRVGLITNQTARVGDRHLIDVLHAAPEVELTALFGPEHGLRGRAAAGEQVEAGRDPETGVPIYSLYGEHRAPTQGMLDSVDVLVFDIQDAGARFYTYITTMGLSMQAAAEADVPFVVLDRPNPLGGTYVSGFVLDSSQTSFIGRYPVPLAHGMTVGELARMIEGEPMLPGLEDLELEVVEMENWTRDLRWHRTGLPWLAPSPNLPDFHATLLYPGTALLEGSTVSEGRGTPGPFAYVGAPWVEPERLTAELNRRALPGVRFYPITFSPRPIPGVAPDPEWEGRLIHGVRQSITDLDEFQPVETGVHLVHALFQQAPDTIQTQEFFRSDRLALLAGTNRLEALIREGYAPDQIIAAWADEVDRFRRRRSAYLLY